jgi:hypothetical protein
MRRADARVSDWLRIVRGEYLEMPGLQLTQSQASRLWGLETLSCATILTALVEEDFLRITSDGLYARKVASSSSIRGDAVGS